MFAPAHLYHSQAYPSRLINPQGPFEPGPRTSIPSKAHQRDVAKTGGGLGDPNFPLLQHSFGRHEDVAIFLLFFLGR